MPVVDIEESEDDYEEYGYLPPPDYEDIKPDLYSIGRCQEGFHQFLYRENSKLGT